MSSAPVPISPEDVPDTGALTRALLALNNAHAIELSLLDSRRLRLLVAEAFVARRIGEDDAMILAFDQDAAYDSPNFIWFRERYRRFVYVDRVVVAPRARGAGLARRLYLDLFERGLDAGHDLVVCEVNADPPNDASAAFHAGMGFVPVGSAALAGGAKTVSYLARPLRA